MKKLTVLAAGLLLLVPALSLLRFDLPPGRLFHAPGPVQFLSEPPPRQPLDDRARSDELRPEGLSRRDDRLQLRSLPRARTSACALTVDAYNKSQVGYYNDWVAQHPRPRAISPSPSSSTRATTSSTPSGSASRPVQLSLKFLPLGRRTKIIPYVGGGASLVFYQRPHVRRHGQFLRPLDLHRSRPRRHRHLSRRARSARGRPRPSFGWHAFGGFQVPIGYRATIEAEARYHSAKARFNDLFVDFDDFEVGGLALTARPQLLVLISGFRSRGHGPRVRVPFF